jgi:hypothetical protein
MGVRNTQRYKCALILCSLAISQGDLLSTCNAQQPTAEQQAAEIQSLLQLQTLAEGSSSRQIRQAAIEALPLDNLRPANREAADEILDDIAIFRRLPTVRCEMTPEVYSYFRSNPDMAVGIWHAMGISNMNLQQQSPYSYEMATGDGTHGTIHVLLRSSNNLLMLCTGEFLNPVTNSTISARALFHLVTHFQRDSSGKTWLTHHADMFVRFPSTTVETIARMISPVSNRICDQNFEEITLFVRLMDIAMTRRPEWVHSLSTQVEGVSDESRTQLRALAHAEANQTPTAINPTVISPTSVELAPIPMPMPTLFGEDLFRSVPVTGRAEGPSVN